jgi:hypothetical protein
VGNLFFRAHSTLSIVLKRAQNFDSGDFGEAVCSAISHCHAFGTSIALMHVSTNINSEFVSGNSKQANTAQTPAIASSADTLWNGSAKNARVAGGLSVIL